jgi:hypothetical protein
MSINTRNDGMTFDVLRIHQKKPLIPNTKGTKDKIEI